jgi:hypothetical protein
MTAMLISSIGLAVIAVLGIGLVHAWRDQARTVERPAAAAAVRCAWPALRPGGAARRSPGARVLRILRREFIATLSLEGGARYGNSRE